VLEKCGIEGLEMQTEFLSQCLTAWLEASGRFEDPKRRKCAELGPQNVVYQGRVLVSVLALVPGMLWKLRKERMPFISTHTQGKLTGWLREIAQKADLLVDGVFIGKQEFKNRKYLGSGGIGLFRDTLWAAMTARRKLTNAKPERIGRLASESRSLVNRELGV
jgi:hypothetical protein